MAVTPSELINLKSCLDFTTSFLAPADSFHGMPVLSVRWSVVGDQQTGSPFASTLTDSEPPCVWSIMKVTDSSPDLGRDWLGNGHSGGPFCHNNSIYPVPPIEPPFSEGTLPPKALLLQRVAAVAPGFLLTAF